MAAARVIAVGVRDPIDLDGFAAIHPKVAIGEVDSTWVILYPQRWFLRRSGVTFSSSSSSASSYTLS